MTTQCFLQRTGTGTSADRFSTGTNNAKLNGSASGWTQDLGIRTTRDIGSTVSAATATVTGATNGIEVVDASGIPLHWVSPPIDQDITISGAITKNIWMAESSKSANVGAQVVIERIDSTGAVVSTIQNSEFGTEAPLTTRAAQNWATGTVTSTAMKKGDRIRVRVAGNDIGTMASGFTFNASYGGTTAAADGDSYVTFTETFGFQTTNPSTTTLYPTTTGAGINPGSATENEMWTARGAGVTTAITNRVTGWTAPIQVTDTAGGTALEWYSKPLTAFTLAGVVLANIRASELTGGVVAPRVELAVTASDGTSPTVWGGTSIPQSLTTTEGAKTCYVAGADLAITNGQRIRLRVFIDDSSDVAMNTTGATATLYYAGTAGGASGDTFLTFGQSLTALVTGSLVFASRTARNQLLRT
jgi:hypothetical protein